MLMASKIIYHALTADLKSCSRRRDLQWGRRIHARAVETRNASSIPLLEALIAMYSKCSSMGEARCLFDSIQKPSTVSWNVLLLGYAENGNGPVVLDLFSRMKAGGCVPSSVTYIAALKACSSLNGDAKLHHCRMIHSEIGLHCLDHYVQSTLIHTFAKCGSMVDARRVFDNIQSPDVVSWNALLSGYAKNGEGCIALELFSRMKAAGACVPDSGTYVAAIQACISLAVNGAGSSQYLELGRRIHSEVGCHLDHYLQNLLIDMYAKCGSMVDAHSVFDSVRKPDVVSWTSLILGYAEYGDRDAALGLFSRMKACSCAPDHLTYVAALKACTSLAVNGDADAKSECLKLGREIQLEMGGFIHSNVQSAVIDMYAKCGSMLDARRAFETIQKPNVASWTALLLGYVENGQGQVALDLFSRMQACGCTPDSVTYVAALKSCTWLAATGNVSECLERGRKLHLEIGARLDHRVQSTLIEMYSKCRSMVEARSVFDKIVNPDVVSWTALILGYVENGDGRSALDLFSRMEACGCVPNCVTHVAALKACGLLGALDLGRKVHSEIREFASAVVTCLVDFYAKCGSIAEAREVFDSHSAARSVSTWNALLAGYSSFGDSASLFILFEAMKEEGFRPCAITFASVLLCCSHAGLVLKAREYFESMSVQFGVTPTVMHYTCMVDVHGRVNQLNEAIALLRVMPWNPDVVVWTTLLGACRKWRNIKLGKMAVHSLVSMHSDGAFAHVLMAQMCKASSLALQAATTSTDIQETDSLKSDSVTNQSSDILLHASS